MPAARHVLVLGDSLSFHGPEKQEVLTHPGLYPNVCAAALARVDAPVAADLLARPGWTARDGWWALTKDPRAWGVFVPRADALVIGVGQMDHLPAALPTWLREGIPYVRPGGLRRRTRAAYQRWAPGVIRATRGGLRQLPQPATDQYLSRIVQAMRHWHPGLPIVLLGPSPHGSPMYPTDRHHAPAVEAARRWADRTGVGFVDLDPIVAPSLRAGTGNPDGLHWAWQVHDAIGTALAGALVERGWVT
jgi:hypothetical protein